MSHSVKIMRTVKRLGKYVIFTSSLLLIVAIIQTGTAIYFSKAKIQIQPADLVVVFPGDPERIHAGLVALENGLADNLMIIGKTSAEQTALLNKSPLKRKINVVDGGKSRSTFEDVAQTLQTIQDQGLKSVIVVTSNYHLPRSLLLIKGYLMTSFMDVSIQGLPVTSIQIERRQSKNYTNEIVKFWGSFTEMVTYRATGMLLLNFPVARTIQKNIKRILIR